MYIVKIAVTYNKYINDYLGLEIVIFNKENSYVEWSIHLE